MATYLTKVSTVQYGLASLKEPFKTELIKLLKRLKEDPVTRILKVFETIRTKERQDFLVKHGYSKTHHSAHLYGYAADIVPYDEEKGWSWANIDITGDGSTVDEYNAFIKMRYIIVNDFPKLRILGKWDMAHVELKRDFWGKV